MPNISVFKHKEGAAKADFVKKIHEQVKAQIEKKTESYAKQANKGRKKMVFQPGDWVWVHFRKERFPEQRKSKLHPRGDGPFRVLEKIGDNAYKIELPSEYNVSSTFNVADISLFDVGEDLRTNPIEEGGNDGDHIIEGAHGLSNLEEHDNDSKALEGIGGGGPMTRARARKTKEVLHQLMLMHFGEKEPPLQVQPKFVSYTCLKE